MLNFTRKLLLLEALKDAVVAGYLDVVRKLLSLDVPLNSRPRWSLSETYGWLPLQFAAHKCDVAMTTLLLEAGANVNTSGSGTQPIHIASHKGSLEITSMLLSAGAAADTPDAFGFHPIHLASTYVERSAQIALLVSAGASVEALNPLAPSWQKSPLQLACLVRTFRSRSFLLLANLGHIPPVYAYSGGSTPLFCIKPWAARHTTPANPSYYSPACLIIPRFGP